MRPLRARRSVLYVPASNARALEKAVSLACDAVIFDLEDSVAPDAKRQARDRLAAFLAGRPPSRQERIVRINPWSSQWGAGDLEAALAMPVDAVLLPKVGTHGDVAALSELLADAAETLRLWAMIETATGVANAAAIADWAARPGSRLDCLVVGANDLMKETGVRPQPGRPYLVPWLMQVVLAARAGGLDVIDGVFNDFADADGLLAECAQGRAMGFDGKTLIHPSQVDAANRAFTPSEAELADARAIVAAFAEPANEGRGVIAMGGRMVERLHLGMAEALLARYVEPADREAAGQTR